MVTAQHEILTRTTTVRYLEFRLANFIVPLNMLYGCPTIRFC